jgi:serine/threonine protein kinase
MEYAPLGDLGSYIKEFKEDARSNATSITQQLLEALVVLHERKLCHRNLKPSVLNPVIREELEADGLDRMFSLSRCRRSASNLLVLRPLSWR